MDTVILERERIERISDRFELRSAAREFQEASFADDVRAGLTAPRKHISPKYLYDSLGSALFEAICELPEYYLTRAETEILTTYADDMIARAGGPLEMLELGSGNANKTRLLIESALRAQGALTYRPIDISPTALVASARALTASYATLNVIAHASDYFEVLSRGLGRSDDGAKVLALFLGSNIGNYDRARARALLRALAQALRPGDCLLLGADLKKDERTLELAYDDPTGVTGAFNKNLLGRINRELGGAFDLRDFAHLARYVPESGSVDSFLVARCAQDVAIADLGLHVHFDNAETIHTESSHKFSPDDIAALGAACGFSVSAQWGDVAGRYAVWLLAVN
jgi:dimethylhistidine N-methyltransferase